MKGGNRTAIAAIGTGLATQRGLLRSAGFESTLYGAPGQFETKRAEEDPSFAELRLAGEQLLVVWAAEQKVRQVVDLIRQGSQASVFSLAPDDCSSAPQPHAPQSLKARLSEVERNVARNHRQLKEASGLGHVDSPSAQWLLDNAHALRAHIAGVREALSGPLLSNVGIGRGGLPAVATVAQGLVRTLNGVVSEQRIIDAIEEAQAQEPLLVDELWLLPTLIQLALVEFLVEQGAAVRSAQRLREAAYFWANRLATAFRSSQSEGERILGLLIRRPETECRPFLEGLTEQLQDEDRALVAFQTGLEGAQPPALSELVHQEHQAEAQRAVDIANAFNSLRALSGVDFVQVFEQTSRVERELQRDPGAIYIRSDAETRNQARRAVQEVARASGKAEWTVARAAVELAAADKSTSHVLEYLIAEGRLALERRLGARIGWKRRLERAVRRHASLTYVASITLLTLAFSFVALSFALELYARPHWVLLPLWALALFPLSELAIQIVNMLAISVFQASPLPKMDFKGGIPDDRLTLVVIPMMLDGRDELRRDLDGLEIRYLANPGENAYFALLSDFVDAPNRVEPTDAPLLSALISGIEALNAKHPGARFLAFHRGRTWSGSEQKWIGRERKRGKLEDLNYYLLGKGDPALCVAGTLPKRKVRYVITLDADTQLPPNSARRLIETISHPLNQVQLDPVTKVRRRGFAIIQPRISISLPGATATRFTRIAGDPHGTDPYSRLVSDSQQDLVGHAIFHGKAIYDVAAFAESLDQRFPLETILSHDLIEGAHCGVGLATDIELFETMPRDYASFSRRQHRWIRGDWQIAPWVLPVVPPARGGGKWEPNPLSAIDRWRILDNLRRSLVPPASIALLLAGWFLSAAPAVWTLMLVLAVAIPALALLLDRIALRIQGSISGGRGSYDELVRAAVFLVFLPHQAWLSVDAIGRASYRMLVSRRNLLEWQTADHAGRSAAIHNSSTLRQLIAISGVSAGLAVWQARMHHESAIPLLILWTAAPFLMRWLSVRGGTELRKELDKDDRQDLRQLARRTWRFFDDLVGAQTNWLPPDNTQLAVRIEVAERTSPTNIGLWINAAQAAHDFGYLTGDELCFRLLRTFSTLERMEKHEGHLFNWYRTNDLAPLPPLYVSTVDSGNLLASLWVLEQGCRQAVGAEVLTARRIWDGLADTFGNLRRVAGNEAGAAFEMRALRRMLRVTPAQEELPNKLRAVSALADRLRANLVDADPETRYWAEGLCRETIVWVGNIERYYPWLEVLGRHPDATLRRLGSIWPELRRRALAWRPSLSELGAGPGPMDELLRRRELEGIDPSLAAWLDDLEAEFSRARSHARTAATGWRELADRTSRLAQGINMAVLFDAKRKLFGIGYAVGGPLEFHSHYDLLASECRIASLVAIAKRDVPLEHWARLGRPRTPSPNGQTLLSWGGTMFEYLMPLLFVRTYPNSLLQEACRDAVLRQIEHGRRASLPWGVSESAHSAIDAGGTYQYHAFGIPELSLRRISESERVVAPYATVLALQVDPSAAIANLNRLEQLGLAGPMGFYEAIDFTRKPAPDSEEGVIIYCYMAHHQGMSLVAIDNLLNDGAMQRRFHGDFRIRAIESLLFERIPNSPLSRAVEGPELEPVPARVVESPPERIWTERTAVPRVLFLGNRRLSVAITNGGGGYCRWKGFDLGRWRSDPATDRWGSFIVLQDVKAATVWSATYQPVGGALGTYSAGFTADRATFFRKVDDIESVLEVAVSPDDDAEIRRLRVTNWSSRQRAIDITTFMELALAPHAADRAHPAFSKMFVQTESPDRGVLVATRRKRSPDEPDIWIAQVLVGPVGAVSFETDREIFLGRSNSLESADGFSRSLGNTTGSVVDPVFSLRCRLNIEAAGREEIALVTLAAESREELMALVEKYRRPQAIPQAFELVWNRTQLDLRYLRIGPDDAHRFQYVGGALLYPDPNLRGPMDRIARDKLGQSALWVTSISGDLPMLTVTLPDSRGLGLLRELLLAHKFLGMRGLRFDLVILNQEPASYDLPLSRRIRSQVEALISELGLDKPGGVYVRDWNSLPEAVVNQLLAASHVFLRGSRGALSQQLSAALDKQVAMVPVAVAPHPEEPSPGLPFLELPYFNGAGGFTKDGREYAIYLAPGMTTPLPWANVIAHETFGTMVTESGLGFTWRGNSQANRLTPWHNDPAGDPQSEVIYLRDEESGRRWSVTALPIRERDAYRARHGHGYTVFEHNSHAIGQELTVFVPVNRDGTGENVKLCRLRLRNDSSRERKLTATFFAELVLGTNREEQQLRVSTAYDSATGAVFAAQWWSGPGAGEIAFVASGPKPGSHTGDRVQFLGRNRGTSSPDALDRAHLDNRTGPGLDPAGAVQVAITLPQGGQTEVVFMLGQCATAEECRALIGRFQDLKQVDEAFTVTRDWWHGALGRLTVKTPVLSVDLLLGRWLLYQSLSCRFWGRSALYQSGGAIGFRDQLQDSLAVLYAFPELTRRHILIAATHQFEEGDVQHWWHPDTGLGVRTRCSDDMLWLPYVVAQYVDFTGDTAILDQQAGYLTAPELAPEEHEKMFAPASADRPGTVRDHCLRAIERAGRFGAHGLPLMGSGDWNDGMNLVGAEGKGESVWLAWFLATVLQRFAALLEETADDPVTAQRLRAESEKIAAAVERHCWDGEWYLRAFFDNGEPLGSGNNSEARIDSLAQSWSVISGLAQPARARQAVESARDLLVDPANRIVKLFTPPFDHSQPHPGYIMGYPPGLRENGGQYTHGSLWLALAFARLHEGDEAVRLLQFMNPIEQTRTAVDVARYRGEPYAVAADVSAAPNRMGRSGWTWYTGSAAWMYRIWVEEVLGISIRKDRLNVRPVLPLDWHGFSFTYRFGTATYEVEVRVSAPGEAPADQSSIQLVDDGQTHRILLRIPRRAELLPPASVPDDQQPVGAERERG